jgi:lipoprotein
MKKLLSLFFPFFVFFSCNMDISVPDVSQMNGGNVRLVLGGLQRSVTDGKKMAELSKADYVRVRFVIDGTEIVRHKGKGLDISGEMLTVSDIKSGFYESIEVDIMDKLCTYTAVAKSVTLSATAPNALNASIEKVTPHILVKAAIGGDTAFFAFPDIADLSLGFHFQPALLPNFQFSDSYFDKWGCMFYYNNTDLSQISTYEYSRTLTGTAKRDASSAGASIPSPNVYLDRSKNLLHHMDIDTVNNKTKLKSWDIEWDEIEGTDGIEIEDFNNANLSCKQICVDNGEVYAIMCETASLPNTIKLMKFTINGKKAKLSGTQKLGEVSVSSNHSMLDIADGKIFAFIETNDEEGGVGSVLPQPSFKIFVLNAKNLKVIDQVKLNSNSETINKMLGVRESKVYFGVFGGVGSTADDYVGVYDIEKKSFGKVDSEALVAAMQKLKPSSSVSINYR